MGNTFKRNAFALSTIFLWATAFVITKTVVMSPVAIGAVRCLFASVFLLIIKLAGRQRNRAERKDIFKMMIAGAFGFGFYMVFFNIGLTTLTAATSSIIVALTPVLTAFGASFLFGEKITRVGYITICTAFIGVAVMMLWNGTLSINKGILWMLGCVATFVIYNLLTRRLQMDGYGSVEIVTWAMIAGFIVQVPFAPHMFSDFFAADTMSQLAVVYLGIFCSGISYLTWNKAFQYAEKTTEVSNFMFLTPFASTVLGMIVLHERMDMATAIGGSIIIISVIIFGLKGK